METMISRTSEGASKCPVNLNARVHFARGPPIYEEERVRACVNRLQHGAHQPYAFGANQVTIYFHRLPLYASNHIMYTNRGVLFLPKPLFLLAQ